MKSSQMKPSTDNAFISPGKPVFHQTPHCSGCAAPYNSFQKVAQISCAQFCAMCCALKRPFDGAFHWNTIFCAVGWWKFCALCILDCALDGDEVGRYIRVHSFVLLYTFPSLHCAAGHRRLVGRGRSRPLAAPLTPDPSCLSGKPLVGRRDQKYIFRQNTFNICSGEENKFIYWWWAIHTNQIWKKR